MKINKMVYVDVDSWIICSERGLNISAICDEAIKYAAGNIGLEFNKIENINQQIEKLKEIKEKTIDVIDEIKKKKKTIFNEFLKNTPINIVRNRDALKVWSQRSNISIDKLIAAKCEYREYSKAAPDIEPPE